VTNLIDKAADGKVEFASALRRDRPAMANSALEIIDMVDWQVNPVSPLMAAMHREMDISAYFKRVEDETIPNIARLLAAFRSGGGKVVFLRVGSQTETHGDMLPAMQEIAAIAGAVDGSPACDVVDQLRPLPSESSLLKTGSSGFASSPLDRVLRFAGVENVFYVGVLTNACVLLTASAGFDLGYHGYVVRDATATLTEDMQRSAEDVLGYFIASVVDTDEALGLFEHE
jgi:ureidoacrylate peracid hydrolase